MRWCEVAQAKARGCMYGGVCMYIICAYVYVWICTYPTLVSHFSPPSMVPTTHANHPKQVGEWHALLQQSLAAADDRAKQDRLRAIRGALYVCFVFMNVNACVFLFVSWLYVWWWGGLHGDGRSVASPVCVPHPIIPLNLPNTHTIPPTPPSQK